VLGGAALAGWGVGAFASLEECIARLQPATHQLMPNPAVADLYAQCLENYKRLSRAVNSTKSRS
jgi:sugar (pentulose or hexulose) kinase